MAILEALRIFSRSFQGMLITKSDSSNALSVVNSDKDPWRFHVYFKEISSLWLHRLSACGSNGEWLG